jgi:hypothetical protein
MTPKGRHGQGHQHEQPAGHPLREKPHHWMEGLTQKR